MYQFWETMLFRTGGYAGQPWPKHAVLNVGAAHFDRWLILFRNTLDEHFEGPKVAEAKNWAASIGDTFQRRMEKKKLGLWANFSGDAPNDLKN